ncbi:MAG: GeoRSP system radical SAM/SPASM protein [bacterium]|nr:GeoRSP system radical SAM/SPASM protein [bacterium]
MMKTKIPNTPLLVNWSLSVHCNFNCKHCYSRLEKYSELSTEENKEIVKKLVAAKIYFANFGGGEPFLKKDIFDIALFARENGLHISVSTNGFLVDEEIVKKVKESRISKVEISLDSAREEEHDNFRNKKGSFRKAVTAIELLKKNNIDVAVSSVISKINYKNFSELIDLVRKLGVKKVTFHNYKCSGSGFINRDELDLTPQEWMEFYKNILIKKKEVSDIIVSLDDPVICLLKEFGGREKTIVPGSSCGKLSLAIKPNGDVTPCGFMPVSIGNILKEDISDLWKNSPVLLKLRNKEAKGKCVSCESYEECLGGCSARAYAMSGDFNQPDPHCWKEDDVKNPA